MYRPHSAHEKALRRAAPAARFETAQDEGSAAELIRNADVVLGNRYFLQSLPHARQLRWMQSNSAGVDLILTAGAALDGLVVTCARGVYDDEVADHAVALVLGLARGLHHARDAQLMRRWERSPLTTLRGRRALVLGWGGIGRGIARRLEGFGVEVSGCASTYLGTRGRARWARRPSARRVASALARDRDPHRRAPPHKRDASDRRSRGAVRSSRGGVGRQRRSSTDPRRRRAARCTRRRTAGGRCARRAR